MRARTDADLSYGLADSATECASGLARGPDGPPGSNASPRAVDLGRVIRDRSIERVDFRFANTAGEWCSFISPITDLDLGRYETAGGFPGDSVPWSRDLPALDPIVVPDLGAAFVDPFAAPRTLVVICNVHDSRTRRSSAHDCRSVAQGIGGFIQSTHIGGSPRFTLEIHGVRAFGASAERVWKGWGSDDDIGARPAAGERIPLGGPSAISGCGPEAIIRALARAGVEIENQRDFASGRPVRLAMSADSAWLAADKLMFCKYVIDRVGQRRGSPAGPAGQRAASRDIRVRVGQSIWRNGRPLFAGDGHGGTSAIMRHYAAGLVAHTPALLGILGMDGSARPRAAANARSSDGSDDEFIASDHVSLVLRNPAAMSVVFSFPSVPSNPYLALAAMALAGVDGFNYRLYNVDPFLPLDEYFGRRTSEPGPSSDTGREFLYAGNLFTPELLSAVAVGGRAGGRR